MDETEGQIETSGEVNPDRLNKVSFAQMAEQAERYEDMVDCMKEIIQMGGPLSLEERNLFSVAYKNVVGARRSGWRMVSSYLSKDTDELDAGKDYLANIKDELKKLCNEVLELIDNSLLKTAEDDSSRTFYLKMKGDYCRYVTEVCIEGERDEFATKSGEAYDSAYNLCKEKLKSYHPIRLGVALNYSVFHYEIEGSPTTACEVAKTAFDDAVTKMDDIPSSMFKDSSLILQLLRDNITLWTSETGTESAEDPVKEE